MKTETNRVDLIATLLDSDRRPTKKSIAFTLKEDLIEMEMDGIIYFNYETVYLPFVKIGGALYGEVKRVPKPEKKKQDLTNLYP